MFYIKSLIIVGIVILCTSLGIKKANTFNYRTIELKNIKNALQIFSSKIQFTYEPISDIFDEISKVVYFERENIFKKTNEILQNEKKKTISECFYEAVEKDENYLKEEDKEIIKMLGHQLGKIDKDGQISEIQVTSEFLQTQINKAEEEKNKNVKLYKTLGTVIGCGIGIILF